MEGQKYANFGYRLVDGLIDIVLVFIAYQILGFLFGFLVVVLFGPMGDNGPKVITAILLTFLPWLYYAGFESSKYQGTFGKRIVGIRVADAAGARISFGKATVRHFTRLLSWATVGIGFIMITFGKRKRALHDVIAGTVVVRTNK